jgi:hypothetical protein
MIAVDDGTDRDRRELVLRVPGERVVQADAGFRGLIAGKVVNDRERPRLRRRVRTPIAGRGIDVRPDLAVRRDVVRGVIGERVVQRRVFCIGNMR